MDIAKILSAKKKLEAKRKRIEKENAKKAKKNRVNMVRKTRCSSLIEMYVYHHCLFTQMC